MPGAFDDLARGRRSVRAYSSRPVERAVLEEICVTARAAPSGANLQPGAFHILTGSALCDLKTVLQNAAEENRPHDAEYSYFPASMPPDLKARQRAAGYALYQALGIARRDVAARKQQFARNYAFFDAPVGVVVTIQRDMGKGCFMDLGMAIMNFLLAAEDRGLASTGIGALANYGTLVHAQLGLSEDEMVVCGLALGYADRDAVVNTVRAERAPLESFTTFRGFETG